jgi:hypothetical protein
MSDWFIDDLLVWIAILLSILEQKIAIDRNRDRAHIECTKSLVLLVATLA